MIKELIENQSNKITKRKNSDWWFNIIWRNNIIEVQYRNYAKCINYGEFKAELLRTTYTKDIFIGRPFYKVNWKVTYNLLNSRIKYKQTTTTNYSLLIKVLEELNNKMTNEDIEIINVYKKFKEINSKKSEIFTTENVIREWMRGKITDTVLNKFKSKNKEN